MLAVLTVLNVWARCGSIDFQSLDDGIPSLALPPLVYTAPELLKAEVSCNACKSRD